MGYRLARVLLLCAWAGMCACAVAAGAGEGGKPMAIKVTSSAFVEGGMIPKRFSGEGEDLSPPLSWEGVPEKTKSIALICDDPDAPRGTFVHWVLFNLPADAKGLPEGTPRQKTLASGARQGMNDFPGIGYNGPLPPGGTHRYYFRVYALDNSPGLEAGAKRAELVNAMKGHVLGEGQLMGKYTRTR